MFTDVSERINPFPTHTPKGIPFIIPPNFKLPGQYRSRGPGVVGRLPKVRNELAAGPPRRIPISLLAEAIGTSKNSSGFFA